MTFLPLGPGYCSTRYARSQFQDDKVLFVISKPQPFLICHPGNYEPFCFVIPEGRAERGLSGIQDMTFLPLGPGYCSTRYARSQFQDDKVLFVISKPQPFLICHPGNYEPFCFVIPEGRAERGLSGIQDMTFLPLGPGYCSTRYARSQFQDDKVLFVISKPQPFLICHPGNYEPFCFVIPEGRAERGLSGIQDMTFLPLGPGYCSTRYARSQFQDDKVLFVISKPQPFLICHPGNYEPFCFVIPEGRAERGLSGIQDMTFLPLGPGYCSTRYARSQFQDDKVLFVISKPQPFLICHPGNYEPFCFVIPEGRAERGLSGIQDMTFLPLGPGYCSTRYARSQFQDDKVLFVISKPQPFLICHPGNYEPFCFVIPEGRAERGLSGIQDMTFLPLGPGYCSTRYARSQFQDDKVLFVISKPQPFLICHPGNYEPFCFVIPEGRAERGLSGIQDMTFLPLGPGYCSTRYARSQFQDDKVLFVISKPQPFLICHPGNYEPFCFVIPEGRAERGLSGIQDMTFLPLGPGYCSTRYARSQFQDDKVLFLISKPHPFLICHPGNYEPFCFVIPEGRAERGLSGIQDMTFLPLGPGYCSTRYARSQFQDDKVLFVISKPQPFLICHPGNYEPFCFVIPEGRAERGLSGIQDMTFLLLGPGSEAGTTSIEEKHFGPGFRPGTTLPSQ